MSGEGSPGARSRASEADHALLVARCISALTLALRGQACRVYARGLRIQTADGGEPCAPDLSVICGKREAHPDDAEAATNPRLLVEVLSPSTEAFDRGDKASRYRSLPSLQDYVLVSTERVRAEVFSRNDDDSWTLREVGPGRSLRLPSLDLELDLNALYEGTELLEAEAAAG